MVVVDTWDPSVFEIVLPVRVRVRVRVGVGVKVRVKMRVRVRVRVESESESESKCSAPPGHQSKPFRLCLRAASPP